jgi:hypothetical protein
MTKNHIALFLLLLTSSALFAQINFEKGYFISNNGQKTDCYIKNVDWINNPVEFEYRMTPEGDMRIGKLNAIKEFTIPSICKYEKHTVNVDMSQRNVGKLNYDKKPEWQEKTILLNVLVEGDATLYRYKDADLSRFFFKKGNAKIQQLVFKNYLTEDGQLAENNEYRQQLYTSLVCESISRKRVSKLRHNRNALSQFFVDYNTCKNNDFTVYEQVNKGKFSIRANIGVSSQKTVLKTGSLFGFSTDSGVETEQKWTPRIGVDLEYLLPFNKNKWAVFIEPNYQSYKGAGSITSPTTGTVRTYGVEYSAIQVPLGVRHYMFLNDTSKLFLNAGILVDFPLSTELSGILSIKDDSFKTAAGALFGLGYSYDNTYFVEMRFGTGRELLEKTAQTTLKLSQFSFIVGYRFF